jgi:hypothetical protein
MVIEKKGEVCPFSKGSWWMVRKQTRMLFALLMGLKTLLLIWLTNNKLDFSIGFSLWTYRPNNGSHQSSMINTKPYVMYTKKPHPWKKLTFDMLPIGFNGTCLELQMRVPFTNSTIGSLLALSCVTMGRLHVICKFFHITFFKFYFPSVLVEV